MGTLIFSYIRRLGSFLGLKILNFYTFWAFQFVDIFFWVITKLDYIQGSFLCISGSFLKVNVQNGVYFWE